MSKESKWNGMEGAGARTEYGPTSRIWLGLQKLMRPEADTSPAGGPELLSIELS